MKKVLFIAILPIVLLTLSILQFNIETSEVEAMNFVAEPTQIPTIKLDEIKEEERDIYTEKCDELLLKQQSINVIDDTCEWYKAYKNLINEYSEWCDSPESIYDYFNEDELLLIFRTVETETYQQDFESKANVAAVIFSRLEHESFPDNIEEVVTSANQFAYWRTNISEDTILACEYAFQFPLDADEALYFHSNSVTSKFNGADYLFTDKAGHHFYGKGE